MNDFGILKNKIPKTEVYFQSYFTKKSKEMTETERLAFRGHEAEWRG